MPELKKTGMFMQCVIAPVVVSLPSKSSRITGWSNSMASFFEMREGSMKLSEAPESTRAKVDSYSSE